jgi:predicted 3-demethylubiquinone-9 3-methyltransferase (glyoxalase superfamily)
MLDIKTCLWFQADAEDAANFYVSLFPGSRVKNVMRAGPAVVAVDFELNGASFLALNGRSTRGFTDASSHVVTCASQEEIDRYWDGLVAGGGEEGQCGWLRDRFGVSWQVVPERMGALLGGPDPAAAGRAMQAMLGMRKLDVAALERARAGQASA